MTEYLTGAALYRAMADMLDGGRELQMLYTGQDDWRRATNVTTYCAYRLKPVEKRTVTINGKVLVAPVVEAPPDGTLVWFSGVTSYGWDGSDIFMDALKDGRVFLTREDRDAMGDWITKCRLGQTS